MNEERFLKLTDSFAKELKRKNITVPLKKAHNFFREFSTLPFNHCAVDLSETKLRVTLVFPEDKLFMIHSYWEDTEDFIKKDEVFFSFFIKRLYKISEVMKFEHFISGTKKYFEE